MKKTLSLILAALLCLAVITTAIAFVSVSAPLIYDLTSSNGRTYKVSICYNSDASYIVEIQDIAQGSSKPAFGYPMSTAPTSGGETFPFMAPPQGMTGSTTISYGDNNSRTPINFKARINPAQGDSAASDLIAYLKEIGITPSLVMQYVQTSVADPEPEWIKQTVPVSTVKCTCNDTSQGVCQVKGHDGPPAPIE